MKEASKGHRVSQAQPHLGCPDCTHSWGESGEMGHLGHGWGVDTCLTWENVTMGPKG